MRPGDRDTPERNQVMMNGVGFPPFDGERDAHDTRDGEQRRGAVVVLTKGLGVCETREEQGGNQEEAVNSGIVEPQDAENRHECEGERKQDTVDGTEERRHGTDTV